MLQKIDDIEKWHSKEDPWGYNTNKFDVIRKEILLNAIPKRDFKNVLDIGCGQGFITKDLPGLNVYGIDISESAINFAKKLIPNVNFLQGSIFDIDSLIDEEFDLIVITGVLYQQYIGDSSSLIYILIDKILKKGGVLISVHIDEWYSSCFPYFKIHQIFYDYREFTHNLEMYSK